MQFCLDPGLDPLGSTGSQNAPGVLFTTLWLGSVLGSTWIHDAQGVLFTTPFAWIRAWIHSDPLATIIREDRSSHGRSRSGRVPKGEHCKHSSRQLQLSSQSLVLSWPSEAALEEEVSEAALEEEVRLPERNCWCRRSVWMCVLCRKRKMVLVYLH